MGKQKYTNLEGYDSLAELALNMRSSWDHATDEVWQKLDPVLWERTHNPWGVLNTIPKDRLERAWPILFSARKWMILFKPGSA